MINKEVLKEIERINTLNDFDIREQLKGYGFKVCIFLKQFYKIDNPEYKENYIFMFNGLEEKYKKANENLRVFNVDIEIKNKRGLVLNYNITFEERNEEEVLKRIKERVFYNYYSKCYLKINNPIFNKIELKEVLK
jgi:hypothetical protein